MDNVTEEDDASAIAIHYSLDIETRNDRMTAAERAAVRDMMQQLVTATKVKLQLVLGDRAKVSAHIAATNTGRRELTLDKEATHE